MLDSLLTPRPFAATSRAAARPRRGPAQPRGLALLGGLALWQLRVIVQILVHCAIQTVLYHSMKYKYHSHAAGLIRERKACCEIIYPLVLLAESACLWRSCPLTAETTARGQAYLVLPATRVLL